MRSISALASAKCTVSGTFVLQSMGRRTRKFWVKTLIYRCPDCMTERRKQLHHCNKNEIMKMTVSPQSCFRLGIHGDHAHVDMTVHEVSVVMAHTPQNVLMCRAEINDQRLVDVYLQDSD